MEALTSFAQWWWNHVIAPCDFMMWLGIVAAVAAGVAITCLLVRDTGQPKWWYFGLAVVSTPIVFWIWPVVCVVVVVIYALVLVGEVVDI